jgi:hypothetical protein
MLRTDVLATDLTSVRRRPKSSRGGAVSKRRGNDSDRYVVPAPQGGWNVVKEDHQRASVHTRTKAEAIGRAREIVENLGGGEVRIQNQSGRFIDSDTTRHGQESKRRDRK